MRSPRGRAHRRAAARSRDPPPRCSARRASGALASICLQHRASAAAISSARRHDAIHEPDAVRFGGVDHLAGEEELQRASLADEARQPLRPAVARAEAELHLGLSELRRVGGDADVARHRQLAAAAEREAVDRGDRPAWATSRTGGRRAGRARARALRLRSASARRARAMSAPATNARPAPVSDARRRRRRVARASSIASPSSPMRRVVERVQLVGPIDRDRGDAVGDARACMKLVGPSPDQGAAIRCGRT